MRRLQTNEGTHWVLIGGLLGIAVWLAFPVHADAEVRDPIDVRSAQFLLTAGVSGCLAGVIIEATLAARRRELTSRARFTVAQLLLAVAIIAISLSLWLAYRAILA